MPNTICFNIFVEGKVHDARMLAESHLYDNLEQFAFSPDGQPMCIYGDLPIHLEFICRLLFVNNHLTHLCVLTTSP
jgi:hypothetical protein